MSNIKLCAGHQPKKQDLNKIKEGLNQLFRDLYQKEIVKPLAAATLPQLPRKGAWDCPEENRLRFRP